MYGAEVGETDHICLCNFLQAYNGAPLEVQVILAHFKGYLRREFPDDELGALLELPDLLKSNCTRPVLPGLF